MKLSEVMAAQPRKQAMKLSQVIGSAEPEYQAGIGRTALDQALQGATFGFADEIADRLGAGIASLATDESYGDLLNEARGMTKERMAAQMDQRPALSIGANLGGAILTGGAGATTKGGKALATRLGSGGLGARIAKGIGGGAASGGVYGFGSGDESFTKRLSDAGQGAILGGAVGGVLPAAGGALRAAGDAVIPKIDDAVKPLAKRAMDLGIPLRVDQISPTRARKTVQKISQEIPFSGASDFEAKQIGAWNKSLAKTIGLQTDNLSPESIQQFIANAETKFGVLTNGKTIKVTPRTFSQIDKAVNSAAGNVRDDVVKLVQANADALKANLADGAISGKKIASIRSDIIKRLPSIDPQARPYVAEFVDAIDQSVIPALSKAERATLQQARKEWRNFKTIEPLLEKSTDGMVNPTQLLQRVQSSKFIKASRLKTGDDELVDLARIGKKFLPKDGGSDTFQKAAIGGGGGALAVTTAANPVAGLTAAALAGAGMGANRAFQGGYNASQRIVGRALQDAGESAPSLLPLINAPASGSFAPVINAPERAPTRITVNPAMQGREGAPDVNLPQSNAAPLLDRIAQAESSGNPMAQAKTSSAFGIHQYTKDTWRNAVKKYGNELGVRMGDIANPDAQYAITQTLIEREYVPALSKVLGRAPDGGEIYLAHFAGTGGAKRLLRAPENAVAARLLPKAAAANRPIFYDDGRPRKVGEVLELVKGKVI